ncbi:unnamed protein product [Pylaiella littoralis]
MKEGKKGRKRGRKERALPRLNQENKNERKRGRKERALPDQTRFDMSGPCRRYASTALSANYAIFRSRRVFPLSYHGRKKSSTLKIPSVRVVSKTQNLVSRQS